MAKKRPSLGTFANPTQTFVAPVQAEKTVAPLDQQAIRETYAFADAFGELSQSMVKVASTIKTEMNAEQFRSGQEAVNSSRRTYAQMIQSGQINPSENPWMALGAQRASGVLEASRARNEFKAEYDTAIAANPDLLKDNTFFDALAASYATKKSAEFGTASYLSEAFFDQFNPSMVSMSAEHASNVGKYRQGKIMESIKIKVADALSAVAESNKYGYRVDGSQKDLGWYGVMYDTEGNAVTEKSITITTSDAGDIQIPLLVPGLSLAGREAIVYASRNATPDEILGSLSEEDRNLVFDHARKRVQEGKSPFYDTTLDKVLPELQLYMDDQGQNMGMPRVANLSTAVQLIEAMKSSSMTYEAEELLGRLMAGTGRLADVSEVKAMLVDAQADIAKNRADLAVARDKQIMGMETENAYYAARTAASNGNENLGMEAFFDDYSALLKTLPTLGPIERGKAMDSFTEAWRNGTREGNTSLEYRNSTSLKRLMAQDIEEMQKALKGQILDWGSLRRQFNDRLRTLRIDDNGVKAESGRKDVVPVINNYLEERRRQIEAMNVPPAQKARLHQMYRLEEINAAIHFGLDSRVADLRDIAMNGISIDVERGIRPELVDLIEIYNNFEGGQGPIEVLFSKGEAGQRTLRFLQEVRMEMRTMSMPDAVRDVAQRLNMDSEMDILSMTDMKANGADMIEFRNRVQYVQNQLVDTWWPFGLGETPLNPDANTAVSAMFTKKFIEAMRATKGSFHEALEVASDHVYENTMIVNLSVIPKGVFGPDITEQYFHDFINVEAGPGADEKLTTLVVVGDAPNGEPVFALRDAYGNAVKDRYYTIADIAGKDRPRDEEGNVIPGSLSPYERVVQEAGRREARGSGRIPIESKMRNPRAVQPAYGAMK
jgi:hypothetical protein